MNPGTACTDTDQKVRIHVRSKLAFQIDTAVLALPGHVPFWEELGWVFFCS